MPAHYRLNFNQGHRNIVGESTPARNKTCCPYEACGTYSGSSGAGTPNVTYKIVALYDLTAPDNSGTAVPIKLQLTNYSLTKHVKPAELVVTNRGD